MSDARGRHSKGDPKSRLVISGNVGLSKERQIIANKWKKLSDAGREKYGYDFTKFMEEQKKNLQTEKMNERLHPISLMVPKKVKMAVKAIATRNGRSINKTILRLITDSEEYKNEQ